MMLALSLVMRHLVKLENQEQAYLIVILGMLFSTITGGFTDRYFFIKLCENELGKIGAKQHCMSLY